MRILCYIVICALMCSGCAASSSEEEKAIEFNRAPQSVSDTMKSEEATVSLSDTAPQDTVPEIRKDSIQSITQNLRTRQGHHAPHLRSSRL